jgi:outer membrane protein OmpA-like peptidoglycan-associated protein
MEGFVLCADFPPPGALLGVCGAAFTFLRGIHMSFSSSDDERQERVVLGFLFALVAIIVLGVIALVMASRPSAAAKAAAAAPIPVAATGIVVLTPEAVAVTVASVVVDNGIVKFYFASGKAELAAGANEALADVIKGVAAGKRAVVSGFHDASGNAAVNAEVSKERAIAVRSALMALGVPEDKVELKKPEETTAAGPADQARRVEVTLAD